MSDLFRRAWDIRAGTVRIAGEGAGAGVERATLDASFEIEKSTEREPNTASVKIWILPTGDKYNLIWDKIRTCTGHFYTYDAVRDGIRRHPGCFYFPFNVEIDEREKEQPAG